MHDERCLPQAIQIPRRTHVDTLNSVRPTRTDKQGAMSYTFGSYPGGVWEGPRGHTICANWWCKSLFTCHT